MFETIGMVVIRMIPLLVGFGTWMSHRPQKELQQKLENTEQQRMIDTVKAGKNLVEYDESACAITYLIASQKKTIRRRKLFMLILYFGALVFLAVPLTYAHMGWSVVAMFVSVTGVTVFSYYHFFCCTGELEEIASVLHTGLYSEAVVQDQQLQLKWNGVAIAKCPLHYEAAWEGKPLRIQIGIGRNGKSKAVCGPLH